MKAWQIHPIRLIPALPALAALGIYLSMLPAVITTANYSKDGGDFLAAALTGGVPHPGGYPAYILLLRIFLGLPFGSNYFKGSLLSAAAAALAVLLISYLIAHRSHYSRGGIAGALTGGLALAFATLFWSQAVVVEVQALQAFFVALALLWVNLLEELGYSRSKRIGLLALAWSFGVGTGSHLTILFLLPLAAMGLRKASVNGLPRRWITGQGIAFLAGCLVYLYLPFAARQYPPVNWGIHRPWQVFGGRSPEHCITPCYSGFPQPNSLDAWGRWQGCWATNLACLAPWLGWWGWYCSNLNQKLFRWGLVWIFAVYSIFYLTYNSNDAVVYLVSAWIGLAIWIGNGITTMWERKFCGVPWGMLASIVVIAAIVGRIPQEMAVVDPRRNQVTQQYLETVEKLAPPDAIIFTAADADSFPMWYAVLGEGMRNDLNVIVVPLTQFDWYQETLRHTYPDLVYPPPANTEDWAEILAQLNAGHATCFSETVGGNLDKIKMTCDGIEILNLDFH